jgi:hypothetical protein
MWLVVPAVLVLLVAACGDDDDAGFGGNPFDEVPGGADVDVSGEGDDFTIEFEDDEGGGVITGGADIPADFPMPLPDTYQGVGSSSFESGGERTVSVVIEIPASDVDEVAALYERWMESQGIEADTFRMEAEGSALITVSGERDGETFGVTITNDGEETVASLIWVAGG